MRCLEHLSGPLALSALAVETLRGRASVSGLGERLCLGMRPVGGRPVWVHAASNGEVTSVRPFLEALVARNAELAIVLTVNTASAKSLAEGFGLLQLSVRLAPVDLRGAVRRFLTACDPRCLVIVENELWPRRMAECRARGVPVLVIGGRMSARAADRWRRFPGLARAVTGRISWLSAQDAASGERFVAAGLPPERLGPVFNLKSGIAPTPPALPYPAARRRVVLAASTHEGEDAEVIAAFALAREKVPDLHLVIAPRHPRRRDRIEAALGAAGLSYSTRSRGRAPDGAMDAYLADTLGEMGNWYAAAAMTFVGGSLVDRGGHTPFEPAAHGSAIVSGLHVGNFRDTYAALAAAGACRMVGSGAELAEAFGMLRDPAFAPGLARRAAAALADRRQGGLDVILRAVEGFAGLDRAVRGRGSSGEGIAGKRAQDVIR